MNRWKGAEPISEAANPIVREIPATIGRLATKQTKDVQIKRVAAYARVSTETEEQQNSYEAQVSYYTQHIQGKKEWAFAGVYSDEGISGTSIKKRDGFNRMVANALAGQIDLIVTKSVSRFARNTVDTLSTVRTLKKHSVEVYFEKENIYTLDSKGELLITIMSSLAQEESRSISENVIWGQRMRFADGKVSMPYKQFLGYEKGEDGRPRIVPEQAEIIRLIYRLFIEGQTPSAIAKYFTRTGIPTPAGKANWQGSTVRSILTNEKYKGDAILQKTFCVDFLTKKMKPNESEVPQYYVENSHPAIIQPVVFDEVQQELARQRQCQYTCRGDCFSSHIICGECGAFYGSKVWHSNDPYRHTVWECNSKYKNERICTTPHLTEDEIKAAFVRAVNQMISSKADIVREYREIINQLTDAAALEDKLTRQREEHEVVEELLRKLIAENAHKAMDQEEYSRRENALQERYETAQREIASLEKQRNERKVRREQLSAFLNMVEDRQNLLEEFDEHLWRMTIETVTIYSKEKMIFRFKGGVTLKLKG